MAQSRCINCSAPLAPGAKFCPRCGHDVAPDGAAPAQRPGVHPASSPVPVAGILFLVAAVLGPTLIGAGIYLGAQPLLYAGIAVAVGLILLLLLGMFF